MPYPIRTQIRTIFIVVGGVYAGFSLLMLGMIWLQQRMLQNFGPPDDAELPGTHVLDSFYDVHDVMLTYAPAAIALGLCYLGYGLVYRRYAGVAPAVLAVLTVAGVILAYRYATRTVEVMSGMFQDFPTGPDAPPLFEHFDSYMAASSYGQMAIYFLMPQAVLAWKLRQAGRAEAEQAP